MVTPWGWALPRGWIQAGGEEEVSSPGIALLTSEFSSFSKGEAGPGHLLLQLWQRQYEPIKSLALMGSDRYAGLSLSNRMGHLAAIQVPL